MAKDPAFLFYPSDWIGGTMGMTFEEKGAYMELLMMQFNRGHMTTHMIGQTVGQLWENLKDKFVKDEFGLYYNERLESEKEKRAKYSESRRNNIKGENQYSKSKNLFKKTEHMRGHMEGHMTSHMVNGDINRNINKKEKGVQGEKEKKSVKKYSVQLPLQSVEMLQAWERWKLYKKEQHRFTYKSADSELSGYNELMTLAKNIEQDAIKIIDQSITKTWKGLFELKPVPQDISPKNYLILNKTKEDEQQRPNASEARLAALAKLI